MDINSKVARLIDEVRNDRKNGASQLARQAMAAVKVSVERSQASGAEQFLEEQEAVGEKLMAARPAMAPVFNIVSRFLSALAELPSSQGLDYFKSRALVKADELARVSLQAVAQVTTCGSGLINDGDKIMTHSYSSTVMAVFNEACDEGRHFELIVTRSGAGGTGQRIARELGRRGVVVTFIDDTAAGVYVSEASKVMVGADRICADGKVVNGVGTYPLALAAERAVVPFLVLCETLKFDPRTESSRVDLEEKEPAEVIGRNKLPSSVVVKNPYFDITPLELVTGVVTENGLLKTAEVSAYLKKLLLS